MNGFLTATFLCRASGHPYGMGRFRLPALGAAVLLACLFVPAAAAARPRLDHFRTSWTFPGYEIRFHIHFRLCGGRGDMRVRAVEKSSPPGQNSPVWASNVRAGRADQWHRCQYYHFSWELDDQFTGISRYRVRVLARINQGAWSNEVRYHTDTYD